MDATKTSYKADLSHWEACLLERLLGLVHEIMLNQVESPIVAFYRLADIEVVVQDLVTEFERDRDADDELMDEQEEAICG